jgi:DedD protein
LDTALKHRLTGAVILVLLAVALLPELLTGSGRAARPNALLPSEAGSAPERSIDIDLTEAARAPAGATPTPAPTPAPPPAPIELPTPPAVIEPAPAATPNATVPSGAAVSATTTPSVKAAPAATVTPPAADPAKAAPAKAAPVSAGTYFVQLGVFVNRASADRLERTLRRQSFTPIVKEVTASGKRMYRVRVGPEIDRAAANALLKRLNEAGHKGSVVK